MNLHVPVENKKSTEQNLIYECDMFSVILTNCNHLGALNKRIGISHK